MDNQAIFAATIDHYLAPIRPYLDDMTVTEVMINHANEIFIERGGVLERTTATFTDQEAYEAAVNNILQFTGKSLSDDTPLVDTRLPDGSRVHVAKAPCARFGTAVTIRKFSKANLDIDWLVEIGALTELARNYLAIVIRAEQNMLVAGGTSSGKTSLLNALSAYIPKGERIVVIEDSAELQLQQDHVISMESRHADSMGRGGVGIRDLFRSSLRLRPDRIIIGEVRGGEALDMIQAMTSGHGGSMGTLHANNPADALNRLETLALMSKVDLPLHALRAQVSSAIDIIVQMSRHIGGKRMLTQITEILPLGDDGRYQTQDVFNMQQVGAPEPGSAAARAEETSGVSKKGEKTMQLTWTGVRSSYAGQLRPAEQRLAEKHCPEIFAVDKV